ncbi:hypothetical protein Slala03_77330 [Streptomyces lavendulae subsp. lavendulae]|uniref:hypothetical protein n=1 Tax=Streptomyces lavendulae TaxID=1914 RepID=UPI0024A0C649|nr:hypothetical protein [Streptomyces lavendulae]GLV88044.1 hypothetical protein Slala03_77330 [Streptomyces lavendulae subsp. lavendulae]
MILILGLIILIAAAIIGVVGVFGNMGADHALGAGGDFSIFGYHVMGSTGSVFLAGVVVGGAALLGLALVMLGVRRSARARRGVRMSRREAAVVDRERDDLIEQRDIARTETDGPVANSPGSRRHWFGHRTATR